MRSNNIKPKPNQRALIVNNKHLFHSQDFSEQLWASHRQSHNASRSQALEKSSYTFDIPTLLQIFTQHYVAVEECFQSIGNELTRLQSKLAECFGRFNDIEWKLNREIHQVNEAKSLNQSLMRINKEIEDKLRMVKNDYEELKRRRYVSAMEQKIQELQETVHKMELQSYRNRFNKQDLNSLEDCLDRLDSIMAKIGLRQDVSGTMEEVLKQIIRDLLKLFRLEANVSEWIQEKIHENIGLKFEIIKIQSSYN